MVALLLGREMSGQRFHGYSGNQLKSLCIWWNLSTQHKRIEHGTKYKVVHASGEPNHSLDARINTVSGQRLNEYCVDTLIVRWLRRVHRPMGHAKKKSMDPELEAVG